MSQSGLAIYIKKCLLRQKKNLYENSNISPCKNIIFKKNPPKETKILQDIITLQLFFVFFFSSFVFLLLFICVHVTSHVHSYSLTLSQSIPFVASSSFLTFGQVQRDFQVLWSFHLQLIIGESFHPFFSPWFSPPLVCLSFVFMYLFV